MTSYITTNRKSFALVFALLGLTALVATAITVFTGATTADANPVVAPAASLTEVATGNTSLAHTVSERGGALN